MPTNRTYKTSLTPVNTTDTTQTTLATFSTKTDKVYHVEARVVGLKTTDASQGASYVRLGTFLNDGGVLAVVGSLSTPHTAESDSGWDVTLDSSGTDIRVRVTGNTGDAVSWFGDLTVIEGGTWIANYGLVEG